MKIVVQKAKPADLEILKDGRPVKLKFYENATNRLALAKTKTGGADTGLSKDEEEEFEGKLGLAKGDLGPKSPFWYEFHLLIGGAGVILDTEDPLDELKFKVFGRRSDVAKTTEEALKNPKVKYLMSSEDMEADIKVVQRNIKKRAYARFSEMSPEDMRNYLLSINKRPQNMSDQVVEKHVGDDVDLDPKKFLNIAEDPKQTEKIFINELVMYGLLRKNQSAYVDQEGVPLGYSVGDMLAWYSNKDNQQLIISLKKQLQSKKAKK